jgi:hypothetical protein
MLTARLLGLSQAHSEPRLFFLSAATMRLGQLPLLLLLALPLLSQAISLSVSVVPADKLAAMGQQPFRFAAFEK